MDEKEFENLCKTAPPIHCALCGTDINEETEEYEIEICGGKPPAVYTSYYHLDCYKEIRPSRGEWE